jgi:hypothetical protein
MYVVIVFEKISMSTRTSGRHGRDAWRKWHDRRFQRLPSAHTAFVVLHVPAAIERVVLILMLDNPQEQGLGPLNEPPQDNQAGRYSPNHLNGFSQEAHSIAYPKGVSQGDKDHARYALLSLEELITEARNLAIDFLNTPENKTYLINNSPLVLQAFTKGYLEGYLYGARLENVEQLPSQIDRQIQYRAQKQKVKDEQSGNVLTGEKRTQQAIRDALEMIGVSAPDQQNGFIHHVSLFNATYESYISSERFEKEGDSFRSPRP